MAQYYQIQNLDELKQIYADVQVVQVASDDVGVSSQNRTQQLLLQDDQILLNDGQQVVYQTAAPTQPQYQQATSTQYIIGDDITQQQSQHQQLMLQQHQPTIEQQRHQQQQQQMQQQQVQTTQHYVQDPQQQQQQQQQTQIQAMQQDHHQLQQHIQQQQAQHPAQQQQIYYTTDQILQPQNTIVQHQQQELQQQQQQQIHVQQHHHQQQQQQQQQQQYQQQTQQIVHQQHAMQSTPTHQQVQVYRMQATPQQQQPTQLHQPPTQMMNNTHVIVQQSPGQQLLIQSPQHQEIIMRQQQPSPQRSIVYNTNRVLYQSPQTQTILQPSPQQQQHHQTQAPPQQQHHIQLQTSAMHPQARLVQTRVTQPQQQQQQHPAQHQAIQQGVVFHQLQTVQKTPMQHAQQQQQQQVQVVQQTQQMQQQQQQQMVQPQLVNIGGVTGMRGAVRPKLARGCLNNVGNGTALVTRMTGVVPMQRATVRPMMQQQQQQVPAIAQTLKGPRPRGGVAAGGVARGRGAARGGRGAAAAVMAGRGVQIASAIAGANNIQMIQMPQQQQQQQQHQQQQQQQALISVAQQSQHSQLKQVTIAGIAANHPSGNGGVATHQIKQIYRTQTIDPNGMVHAQQQQQQQSPHQLQLVQRPHTVVAPRFRTATMSVPTHTTMTTAQSIASNNNNNQMVSTGNSGVVGSSGGGGGGSGGNFELDLEDSIQAVVVKKEHQKLMTPVVGGGGTTTTLTTYYAKDDDDNRLVRTQSGACMTLAEFKKRNAAATAAAQQSNMVAASGSVAGGATVAAAVNTGGGVLQPAMRSMISMRANPPMTNVGAKLTQVVGGGGGGGGGVGGTGVATPTQTIAIARLAQQQKLPQLQQQSQPQPSQQQQQQQQMQQQHQQPTAAVAAVGHHQLDATPPTTQSSVSSSVHQTSHNNYEIQTQHVLQNRNGQQMAEKDRNSAKMLVILVSGEQRLITFTLPRESCTVQDLLEQVGVHFDNNTTIQCVENPGANIDFVVTVGFSVQESPSELISRAEQSLQMSRQQESGGGVTAATAAATAAAAAAATANAATAATTTAATTANVAIGTASATTASPATNVAAYSGTTAAATATTTSGSGEDALKDATAAATAGSKAAAAAAAVAAAGGEEVPRKTISGFYAVCQICGFSGYDHAKCERCKRVFHEPPKRVPCAKGSGGEGMTRAEINEKKRSAEMIARLSKTGVSYSTGSGTRGRGGHMAARGRAGRGGRRAETEPVILTLSSDEENDDDASNGASTKMSNMAGNANAVPIVYKELSFEPKMPEKDEIAIYTDFKRDDVTDLSNCAEKLSALLPCRLVRIGTYRFDPPEPVAFTSKGIRLVAPLMSNPNELCTLQIHKNEVVKIVAHFSSTSTSMLCIYTLRKCAHYINTSLNMRDTTGAQIDGLAYFSPTGCYQVRKIIFEFDSISDHGRSVVKSIWDFFDEISETDAHDLLKRAAEADRQVMMKKSAEETTTTQLNTTDIRELLLYPSGKGSISIKMDDYMCLATDQYLNDIIIDFYLKWVHINVIPERQRDKTFIFSTFFYKRLTTLTRHPPLGSSDVRQTAAQKRHARVQNWTKSVNLFEKDYIIIPINEQSHWFLAIICFPMLKGPVTFDTNVPVEPQSLKKMKCKKMTMKIGNTTITPLSKRESVAAADVCVGDEDSERDEAEGDDSDLASEDSDFDNSTNNNSTPTPTPTPPIGGAAATQATNANTTTTSATATTAAGGATTTTATASSTVNANANTIGSGGGAANASTGAASNHEEAIKQPLILIFDSLAGASRSRVVATLRDYLTCEYKAKMPDATPHVYNKDNMPGHCVKVPQQNNFTDCGLYLLQYVEQFFIDPVRNYRLPIKQLTNWFDTLTVTRKREDISILLQKLMNENNGPNQKVILPEIPFPTLNGQLVEPPDGYNVEFEEEEMEEEAVDEEEDGSGVGGSMEADSMTDEINGNKVVEGSTTSSVSPAVNNATAAAAAAAAATITSTATTTVKTTLVPSQGRKILFKRRLTVKSESSGSETSPSPVTARSLLKIRKVEQ